MIEYKVKIWYDNKGEDPDYPPIPPKQLLVSLNSEDISIDTAMWEALRGEVDSGLTIIKIQISRINRRTPSIIIREVKGRIR